MGVPQSTTLFGRNTPGGVFTISDLGYTTGAVWFVNSASGTNSVGYGYSPDAPFASVDYAMSQVNVSKAADCESVSSKGCACKKYFSHTYTCESSLLFFLH